MVSSVDDIPEILIVEVHLGVVIDRVQWEEFVRREVVCEESEIPARVGQL